MKNENQVIDIDEIKLQDIVAFFRRNLRLIAIFGALGLLLSITYLVQKPEKYDVQLQM